MSKQKQEIFFDLCKQGEPKDLQYYIKRNTKLLEGRDEENNSVLHYSCHNNIDVIKLLLNNNAKSQILHANNKGEIPLHLALKLNKLDIIKQLLECESEKQLTTTDKQGNIALHLVYLRKLNSSKELILEKTPKKYINTKTTAGKTVLDIACMRADSEAVYTLVNDNSAKVDVSDKAGRTPLHSLMYNKNISEIARFLIKNGADIDAKDIRGEPPLYYAIDHKNPEAVKLLLEEGADIEALKGVMPDGVSNTLAEFLCHADLDKHSLEKLVSHKIMVRQDDLEKIQNKGKLNADSLEVLTKALEGKIPTTHEASNAAEVIPGSHESQEQTEHAEFGYDILGGVSESNEGEGD